MTFLLSLLLAQDLPRVPEGWSLEVVAKAPVLRHPSVVACAPDGRVFVAEDPMDISAPADAALGRVLCLHPDGRVTVFAEKLHAVFGMAYLDGRLYVLHNPKYTRFVDGGDVGLERTDLIAQTNPKPWAHDWNDHVPANFRLGLDGLFYVAVGDKGVFGAVGSDGSKAELRGGGILRMTPDAARLEVVSTGVRNILDVAINAEGDVFTYDNTDEHHWMGRLTHMVDGGFYGYPWDFHPRRPYTLWMLADFGGGAATGALCYEEDAWPAEWRGDLLLADFGKRSVARVKVARAGATYELRSREEILTGEERFRPVGLALSADGRSLYVCDWSHGDTKSKAVVGRLLKVTPPGAAPSPRPAWWAAAASGRAFEASDDALAEALAHPAWSVRMTAQRRLVDRKAVDRLRASFEQGPERARLHALWGLHALAELPTSAAKDPALARHALRALGLRRIPVPDGLAHADPAARFEAAVGLGRGGRREDIPALHAALKDADAWVRYAAWTALRRIGAWDELLPGLRDPALRPGTLHALRGAFATSVVDALAADLRDAEAVDVLSTLVRKEKPWDGSWWSNPYHPALSPQPRPDVEWDGTAKALDALRAALAASSAEARRAAVDALRFHQEKAALPALRARFAEEKDVEVRRSILAAFGEFEDASSAEAVAAAMKEPALGVAAAKAAERLKLVDPLIGLARDGGLDGRRAALEALGQLGAKAAIPALLEAFAKEETRFEAADALARMPDVRALEAYAWGLAGANAGLRERCEKALKVLRKSHPKEVAKLPPPPPRGNPQTWYEHGLATRGEVERGRAIFEDPKGVACAKCHRVKGKGGEIGPDLSTVGRQFSRAELAESVLWPSRKVREGYGQVQARLRSGDVVAGAVKGEDTGTLTLMDAEGRRHVLRKSDIEERRASELSLMPEGLERGLTREQFADLLEYLQSLQ